MSSKTPSPTVVGLTGGIGVGKSTAAAMFASRGAVIADGDALGRAILEPGGAAVTQVIQLFGESVDDGAGGIDRAALGAIVFGDQNQLDKLTAISYPAINRELAWIVANTPATTPLVVLDLAVLVEGKLGLGLYSKVIVVEASLRTRLDRLEGRGMSAADAKARIASQATDEQRRAIADYVINNDGTPESLDAKVGDLFDALTGGASKVQPA